MKKLFAGILALVMVLGMLLCVSGCDAHNGFSSPENAVETFLSCLKNQDLNGMLDCMNTEKYIENFSFEDYTKRVEVFSPYIDRGSADFKLYKDIMKQGMIGNSSSIIKIMTYSLLYPEIDYNGTSIPLDEFYMDDFIESVDPEKLKSLEILSIDINNEDLQSNEEHQELTKKSYCADSVVERVALIKIDGELFCKGFTLAEYDGKWYIGGLSGLLFGDSVLGAASPVASEGEYKSLIYGNGLHKS